MRTRILKANLKRNIKLAAELILKGYPVAFPTETVYGLGADATNDGAIDEIFKIKQRPSFDPLIVHIASIDMLNLVVKKVPDIGWKLIDKFWPGPLTLVLLKSDQIPCKVTAGLDTVAVRMPQNKYASSLIQEANVPVVAPSANVFGHPSPTCVQHVIDDLGGKIPLILDGGPTKIGIESTVLDLTGLKPKILRPGGISREFLVDILGEVSVSDEIEGKVIKSPGLLRKHYSPDARVLLFDGKCSDRVIEAMIKKIKDLGDRHKIGVVVPIEEFPKFNHTGVYLASFGSFSDMETVANNLFSVLRDIDKKGLSDVIILAPPKTGLGLAVFDRLFKAAGSRLIHVN